MSQHRGMRPSGVFQTAQKKTRTLYIGYTQPHYETRRNLTDGDIEYLEAAAAAQTPPITPTRLIEEIISCWCAERRCAHAGTSQTVPMLPGEDDDDD